jgi:hypothetical protein
MLSGEVVDRKVRIEVLQQAALAARPRGDAPTRKAALRIVH